LELEVTVVEAEVGQKKAEEGKGKRQDRWLNGCQVGVDKRTVWGLFAIIQRSYILIQGGLCTAL